MTQGGFFDMHASVHSKGEHVKKLLQIAIGLIGPLAGAGFYYGMRRYETRRTRRQAEAARPKIEALLDEMIRQVSAHTGSLDKIVGMNETKTINDERRERDLSLHAGGTHYSLDVSTELVGKKKGFVNVRVHRSRGDAVLNVSWPSFIESYPMEPWLQERLDRLDALVGTTSRLRSLKRRFPDLDEDKGPPTSN